MNKKTLTFIGAGIIIVGLVAAGYFFLFKPQCPASCDDGNPCTNDVCSKETDYKCKAISISNCCGNKTCELPEVYETCSADCPNCDDNNKCTKDSYDYHAQKCVNDPILDVVCCGNTVCETGETYKTCSRDCPNCDDDNKCTKDSYDYHQQKCVSEIIIPCCGNAICDKGVETYSNCSADCPNCDDKNKLTADSFNYKTQKCENLVTHYFIDDFEEGAQNWNYGATPEDPTASWSTKTEEGNTVFRGVGHNWATLIDKKWDDYIFKAKFKIIKGDIHFNYRLKQMGEQPNRYFVGLGSGGHLVLNKQTLDVFDNNLAAAYGLNFGNSWHTIEIRGYNNILNVLLDGRLLLKYKDTNNPHLSGGIGLETHNNSEYWIDNVEIKVIAEKDIVYP